ncbi:unnamed protein product [Acanthoscelides obtectus]|uniref:Mesoderm induction early response protein 1 n=1 Tax=Acanthoscelides obtectus TaxID=200917 RepID=A0A9P0KYT2_ACAOB|nr:unnamed protein product [Acanthoscelides obtectus]CAK1659817.1 Mesoderm induction early response protein 1 [Acanthoscelides obtectus]
MQQDIVSTNKKVNETSEDKLSVSTVDSLTNDFDEDIRIGEESSSSSDEFDIRKKNNIYYFNENQENESPKFCLTKKQHAPKHPRLRTFYDSKPKYQDASRLLRSKAKSEEEDDTDDYMTPEENRMVIKTIMVGGDFQAQVPDGLCHYDDALPYENEDKLIWDPYILSSDIVEEYLKKAAAVHRPFLPMGTHLRDSEPALYLLQQCGHNVEEALRRHKMNANLFDEKMSPWSEEECRNFEAGVRSFGKNFYLMQQNKVRTRSVGELVQFYYLWKKSERHDLFANKVRLGKKKYTLHPGVTDFMDRFLDEHEGAIERTSSPSLQQPEVEAEENKVQDEPVSKS